MKQGEYAIGELVLVYNEALENRMNSKGALRWRGPYAVVARRPSGAYVVQELDGSVLKQPVAWKRMKSYVPRRGFEPVILEPKWLSAVDDIEEDLLKDDRDELRVMMAHADMIKSDSSWFPKPWLLKGEAANEYWKRAYERWMEREAKKRAGIPVAPEPEIPPEAELMIEDDKQFWNYRDILPDEAGETPRWKYHYPRTRELFDWLPWGTRGKFREVQASPILLTDPEPNELQALGEAQVKLVETARSEKENRPIDGNCRGLYDCLSCTVRLESFIEREMLASPILLAESDGHEIQTLGAPQIVVLNSNDEVRGSAEDLSSRPARKAAVRIINAEIDY